MILISGIIIHFYQKILLLIIYDKYFIVILQ